MEYLVWKRGR